MEHERKGDHGRRGQSHEEFWYTKLRNFLNRVFFFLIIITLITFVFVRQWFSKIWFVRQQNQHHLGTC